MDRQKERLDTSFKPEIQPYFNVSPVIMALTLANSEHLGPTDGTDALSCRLAVLHSDGSGIPHFSLGSAFHTVC